MVGAGVHLGQSAELREAVSLKELHYLFRGERRDLTPSPGKTMLGLVAAYGLSARHVSGLTRAGKTVET